MASFQLEENVIGIPLFVPDAYNFFSIDPGGMPNGDDCLIIHGDVNTSYKAFQRAQTVSPNLFVSKDYATVLTQMAIVFWIKSSPVTISGSGLNTAIIMSVMLNTAAPSSTSSSTWMQDASVWTIAASSTGTNQLGMYKITAASGGGSGGQFLATPPTDTWTMVTMNPSQATDGGIYLNDNASPTQAWSTSGNGTFPTTSVANCFFSLGSYANHANLSGRSGEYRLGKLSFHDHHLNATERALLYNAMT
jgi:hypothetical protein